ncbi:MAG: ABC transporter ATP-binding protein [Anaerolineaceae bacterium]|nr:MAG: ABC transporter ATP-binding protein [Anaerolineaceae bacterium]
MKKAILQADQLTTGYDDGVPVSHGLNLTLRAGELTCLIGPNGAGKSTLLRTVAGLQAPLSGVARLTGKDVARLSNGALARRVSLVLTERPEVGLLNGYALVALGRHPYTDWLGRLSAHDLAMVHWAVAAVGADDIAHKPLIEMSDGQRQKIMIARALAQDTALMILDEPTAYLDLPRRVEIMTLLAHLAHQTGQTILVTTHDLDLALRMADSLWLMSADGAVQVGAPEDLVLNGAFERAFHSEGICFDPQTGTFHTGAVQVATVTLNGTGLGYTWTRRALQRKGWRVMESVATGGTPHIEVCQDGDSVRWTVRCGRQVRICRTVDEAVRALDDSQRETVADETTSPAALIRANG